MILHTGIAGPTTVQLVFFHENNDTVKLHPAPLGPAGPAAEHATFSFRENNDTFEVLSLHPGQADPATENPNMNFRKYNDTFKFCPSHQCLAALAAETNNLYFKTCIGMAQWPSSQWPSSHLGLEGPATGYPKLKSRTDNDTSKSHPPSHGTASPTTVHPEEMMIPSSCTLRTQALQAPSQSTQSSNLEEIMIPPGCPHSHPGLVDPTVKHCILFVVFQ